MILMHEFIATAGRCVQLSLLALIVLATPLADSAEDERRRPITLVVANPAGGATDLLARDLAEELGKRLGQSIIVLNIGGGSGAIGAKRVLHAAPDGRTLLFGTTSEMVLTPITSGAAGYSAADFTAVARVASTPMALVARASLNIHSVDELISRAQPGSRPLTIGFNGTASLSALAAAAFSAAAGIELIAVPYRGGAPLVNDLLGGQVDLGMTSLPGVLQQSRSRQIAMLGVLSAARPVAAPDVPTVNESATVKGVLVDMWAGLAGPPQLPQSAVNRINRAVQDILSDKAFRARRSQFGDLLAKPASAADFHDFVAAEERRYRALAGANQRR